MIDGEDHIWANVYTFGPSGYGIAGVNIDDLSLHKLIEMPDYVHGISIDFDGYVWGVSHYLNTAFRVDPATEDIRTFSDLVGAYTYSDMTGFALYSSGAPAN